MHYFYFKNIPRYSFKLELIKNLKLIKIPLSVIKYFAIYYKKHD